MHSTLKNRKVGLFAGESVLKVSTDLEFRVLKFASDGFHKPGDITDQLGVT